MIQSRLVVASLLSILAAACSSGETSGGRGGHGGSVAGSGGAGGDGGSGGGGAGGSVMGGSGGGTPDAGKGGSGGASPDGGGPADMGGGDTGPAASACKPDLPNSLFCKPTGPMPKTIKETGVFPMAPDLTKHDPSMREFAPSPELWSDGMSKLRFLLLPPGAKIDNSDGMRWQFPVGAVFIKTFFDDSGTAGAPRAIETRFIRKVKDEGNSTDYEYYVYQWNRAGTDADLVIDNAKGSGGNVMKSIPVPIVINRTVNGTLLRINNGMPFMHEIPSQKMCIDCHEESGMVGQTFIGFDEIRMNSKRVATAATTQLQDFKDVFTKPVPAAPATITEANPLLLRVKRFVFGNCVHCHNGNSVFDMHPDVFVENTVGKETEAQSVHPPAGWLRVVPRMPDMSVVYRQMARTNLPPPNTATDERLRPMPPVGVADIAVEKTALDDMRMWILSLPPK